MVSAVIVGGGKGRRIGAGMNKQYIKLANKEIIAWALDAFDKCNAVNEIVLVLPADEIEAFRKGLLKSYPVSKLRAIVPGGEERQDSVYNGLKSCNPETDIVLIHDGARPFVTGEIAEKVIDGARKYGACTAAVRVKDTIKAEGTDGMAEKSLDRNRLWSIQTPQGFIYSLIMKAHESIRSKGVKATDDTAIAELIGYKARLVEGSYFNIKITTPEDIVIGEAIAEKALERKR